MKIGDFIITNIEQNMDTIDIGPFQQAINGVQRLTITLESRNFFLIDELFNSPYVELHTYDSNNSINEKSIKTQKINKFLTNK